MTELDLNLGRSVPNPQPGPARTDKSTPRWEKAAAAGILSFFVVGAGQLYNRQPRKALLLALTIPALLAVCIWDRLLFSFGMMVSYLFFNLGWRISIAAEAAYNAWTLRKPEAVIPHKRIAYPLIAATLLVLTIFPSPDQFKGWTSFKAFRASSASMCPTICMGERIVADMGAYKSNPPERGDVILLSHGSSPALFLKRVIGVSGDVVTSGPNGAIFVNGKQLTFPKVCGTPAEQQRIAANYSSFQSTKIAEGAFFVVGDNLENSFDSRFPEFGPVVREQVRGRPLYIYWSSGHSRIGCRIR
jgi:signal peptidase I